MNCILKNLKAKEGSLLDILNKNALPCALFRAKEGVKPHILKLISDESKRSVVYVMSSDYAAKCAFESYPYDRGVYLPSPQIEFRRMEAKSIEVSSQRTSAIFNILQEPKTVFLSPDSLLYKMRPKKEFNVLTLALNMEITPQHLTNELINYGYERTSLIEGVGQISGRGEIIEVFASNSSSPYRITFFGDEIESIKAFDVSTQRSFGSPLKSIHICPASELCLTQDERQHIVKYLSKSANKEMAERLSYELSVRGTFPGVESFVGLLENSCTILDYMKNPIVVFDEYSRFVAESNRRISERLAMFSEIMQDGDAFGCEISCRFEPDYIKEKYSSQIIDMGSEPFCSRHIELSVRETTGCYNGEEALANAVKERISAGHSVYMFAGGRASALSRALQELDILAPVVDGKDTVKGACCVNARISAGFEIGDSLFLSESELFAGMRNSNSRAKQPAKSKKQRKSGYQLNLLADLKHGDIVVHELHGIGRYVGLKTMEIAGVSADYIELEYRDGDTLQIQTAQIGRVEKYVGPNDEKVKLSKLGGKEWENSKNRARSTVRQLAENLTELYAERSARKGFAFSPDSSWQRQFEDNFFYEETPGQLESIEEIKQDMQSDKIMDRLLLGDVGYGKTEVAMRACFKAVLDSKQVCVLVPTTLLARQHYKTFSERFAGFPLKIGLLSRFTTNEKSMIAAINSGEIDIAIGTHKLLSKSVRFKDLGLLIIDEEQRFGVSHKERIKDMRRDIDVLTLTATPIPRTLEMAMTGIRDMSTIDTPPSGRKEVQSYVVRFSWSLVREAILRELARGGQIYFVCRKISQMDGLFLKLREEVPEVRVEMAHGRLSESEFDRIMTSFYEHEFDLLLSTTIIESGIDIGSVNTIIIYEADMFGLSQLYQLKGRVGRASLRAYAYFTHLNEGAVNEVAQKRLDAIREFTRFGSGFRIALRDLEIRGAGNVLGAEQSGQMSQIGYSLYCKLVEEEVARAMGNPLPVTMETTVELGVTALISKEYIADEAQRLDIYRKISAVQNLQEAKEVRSELTERYGKPPADTENLLVISVIRALASRAHIASIVRKQKFIELKLAEEAPIDYKKLSALIKGYSFVELRPYNPPVIIFKSSKLSELAELLSRMGRLMHSRLE